MQFTLTDAGSRPDLTRDEDDDLQTLDVSDLAPTLGSLTRETVLNNSPLTFARVIAALNTANRSLAARASMCGEPIASALEPWAFALGGGRVVHTRVSLCHDPITGTSYEAQVFTLEGRGPTWHTY